MCIRDRLYHILPLPELQNSNWHRYVDDIFVSLPHNINPTNILQHINNIHLSIQYTLEYPQNSTLPFLDTLISWHNSFHLSFSIYRKPTSNPSYIHWFSSHSTSIKIATLTALYIRALRICSPINLNKENNLIRNTFTKLQYPTYIINKAYKKARSKYYNNNTIPPPTNNPQNTSYLPIPLKNTQNLKKYIPQNITLTSTNALPLKKLFHPPKPPPEPLQCIYTIPCNHCTKTYIGETNNFTRRKSQHSDDLEKDTQNSSLTTHRSQFNHSININSMQNLINISNHQKRKLIETYCIPVSYTHLRAHETPEHLVCRLLLEKK